MADTLRDYRGTILACQLPVVPAFLPSILSRPLEGHRVYPGTPALRAHSARAWLLVGQRDSQPRAAVARSTAARLITRKKCPAVHRGCRLHPVAAKSSAQAVVASGKGVAGALRGQKSKLSRSVCNVSDLCRCWVPRDPWSAFENGAHRDDRIDLLR
ncbi:hypothetical protein HPB50_020153 [Hyalomma asiaticum]|uniref:Uncharacterized protein n=1 Tax=Hyalomma asiaticum TaxID=266040 RepID=A0ACB7TMX7_HYAAI|nr:hypothetical protein HPB50_020153 [Hyalomma asiaticum]